MHEDERVARILVTFFDSDGDRRPEELIREHPELADRLRAQLDAVDAVDAAFGVAAKKGAPDSIGEYRIVRELGRGGMGVVYEAEQMTMERRVALKVLSPSFTSTPQAIARFRREARAAGRLHHTNIVPVYGLGQHGAYWYYAMELVSGQPLSHVIRELRGSAQPGEATLARLVAESSGVAGTTPATGTSARAYYSRIAEMFAGVAEALDLAHREEIVHRDIKPSNLLFAADGTLKIVDFGLAQAADHGPSLTITGDLLGTPLYMSPEQAMAKRADLDHRTDIYSLGATLYEVIVQKPPFEGNTLQSICTQIISKDPIYPRKTNPKIPRDLETIVLKAMEKDRDKRYQSAGELARDLRRCALGEPIRAKRIHLVGRAWRKIKRRPGVAGLVAATVLLAIAGGILGWQAVRAAEWREMVEYEQLLGRAEEAMAVQRDFADSDEVGAALPDTPAHEILAGAIELRPERPDAYWLRAFVAGRTIAQRWQDLDAAGSRGLPRRTFRMTRAHLLDSDGRWKEADAERSAARSEPPTSESDYFEAKIHHAGGRREQALDLLESALEGTARTSHIAFLSYRLRARIRERQGDYDGALEDLNTIRQLGRDNINVRVRTASLWRKLGKDAAARERLDELFEAMSLGNDPGDWYRFCVACRSAGRGDWHDRATKAAFRAFPEHPGLARERALRLRENGHYGKALEVVLAARDRAPGHHGLQGEVARTLADMGRDTEARAAFDQSISAEPGCTQCITGRAMLLFRMKLHDEEIRDWRAAIRLAPRNAQLHYNLGVTLNELGRHEEALEAYRQSIRVDESYADGYLNLSGLLQELGRNEEALPIARRSVASMPEDPRRHANLGVILMALGDVDGAEAAFRESIEVDPEFSEGHNNLAAIYINIQNDEEKALPLLKRAAELKPDDPLTQYNVGLAYNRLERYKEARPWLTKALELRDGNADTHCQFGLSLYLGYRETARALEHYNRSLELDATKAEAYYQRGVLMADAKHQFAAAIKDFRKALEYDPARATAQRNIGICLRSMGHADESLPEFEKAIELDPGDAYTYHQIAIVHRQKREFEGALAAYERGLNANPRSAQLYVYKGSVLGNQLGRHEQALAAFEAAVECDPVNWNAHFNRGVTLANLKRLDEAIVALDKTLEVEPRAARAAYLKGEVELSRARYAQAAKGYRKAADINPRWPAPWFGLLHVLQEGAMHDEAIRAAEAGLTKFPKSLFLRGSLIGSLCATGKHEEASKRAAGWTVGPIPEEYPFLFGYMCAVSGKVDKARKALGSNPQPDCEDLYYIARAYAVLGDFDDAQRCLEESAKEGYRRKPEAFHFPEFALLPAEKAQPVLDRIGGTLNR